MSFGANQFIGLLDDIQRRREAHQVNKAFYQKDLQIHQLEGAANQAVRDRYEMLSSQIANQAEMAAMAAEIALLRDALASFSPGHPCLAMDFMEAHSRAPARERVMQSHRERADELNDWISQTI